MWKQILLIDDDLPFCRRLRDALQDDATEVRYFIDAAEALDNFMRHRYCLVIIDPVLENMDGRELLRTMRQAKAVPILALTNVLTLEDEFSIEISDEEIDQLQSVGDVVKIIQAK